MKKGYLTFNIRHYSTHFTQITINTKFPTLAEIVVSGFNNELFHFDHSTHIQIIVFQQIEKWENVTTFVQS